MIVLRSEVKERRSRLPSRVAYMYIPQKSRKFASLVGSYPGCSLHNYKIISLQHGYERRGHKFAMLGVYSPTENFNAIVIH